MVDSVVVVVVVDPLAPNVLPLLVVVSVVALPVPVPLAVPVLPIVPVLPAVPASVLPGVPVLPMGVVWVLCWPAPVAGSLEDVVGGVLCAMAAPAMATVARPASKLLIGVDAVISETP
jgi:hypothetical protein